MHQLTLNFNTKSFSYHTLENKETKQQKVLSAIAHLGKASDRMIAEYLSMDISCVNGRRNELCALGVIMVVEVRMGTKGKPVKFWAINK